jgi:hypothetical protein
MKLAIKRRRHVAVIYSSSGAQWNGQKFGSAYYGRPETLVILCDCWPETRAKSMEERRVPLSGHHRGRLGAEAIDWPHCQPAEKASISDKILESRRIKSLPF